MAIGERDAVDEIAQVRILARRWMRPEAAIVAGARNLGERAQTANVGFVPGKALRLVGDQFFDDRVEAGATSFGVVASQSRKASRKKCRSVCWRPTSRSRSAMRASARASSLAGRAASATASGEDDGADAARPAASFFHPTFRPRLRFKPAAPKARQAARHW